MGEKMLVELDFNKEGDYCYNCFSKVGVVNFKECSNLYEDDEFSMCLRCLIINYPETWKSMVESLITNIEEEET